MTELKLTLYDNAVNFAEDALVNAIAAEDARGRWKFAILSLVQAIELSLKELLRLQHPLFIYTNIDKPDKTVSINQAKNRLHKITGIQLSSDESKALETASSVRNRIVHYEVEESVADMKLVFARLLGFLSDFHRNHLDESLQSAIDEELWLNGVKIRDYGQELYRRAKDKLKVDGLDDPSCTITCPKCGWDALPAFGDNEDTCYVCGNIEHLVICKRCERIMIFGEHEEFGGETYCWECLSHSLVMDDYRYKQDRENRIG